MPRRDDIVKMETAFLEEIAHNPQDETAVLIYADWLAEQDDVSLASRGEFLRLESILKRGKPGAQRADLEWEARQLWWDHVEGWLGPLYQAVDHFRYERGLLSVEVSKQSLAAMTAKDLIDAPAWDWVRHIGVRKGGLETLTLLSDLPRPRFLESIDIGRKAITEPQENFPVLLGLPILQEVRELDLAENYLGDAGCVELARWEPLATLRKLSLRRNQVTCLGVQTLLAMPLSSNLEELDLSYNTIQDDGARDLADTSSLPRLKMLDLRHNQFGWHSVARLQKRYGDGVETYPSRRHGWYENE